MQIGRTSRYICALMVYISLLSIVLTRHSIKVATYHLGCIDVKHQLRSMPFTDVSIQAWRQAKPRRGLSSQLKIYIGRRPDLKFVGYWRANLCRSVLFVWTDDVERVSSLFLPSSSFAHSARAREVNEPPPSLSKFRLPPTSLLESKVSRTICFLLPGEMPSFLFVQKDKLLGPTRPSRVRFG